MQAKSRTTGIVRERAPGISGVVCICRWYNHFFFFFIKNQEDVQDLTRNLGQVWKFFRRGVAGARDWGSLQFGKAGLKCLGVFLRFQNKNCERWMGNMCAKLSQCTWVLSQLSYKDKVLVTNNLITSTPWDHLTVLKPPETLIREVQKKDCDPFLDWAALDSCLCSLSAAAGRGFRVWSTCAVGSKPSDYRQHRDWSMGKSWHGLIRLVPHSSALMWRLDIWQVPVHDELD